MNFLGNLGLWGEAFITLSILCLMLQIMMPEKKAWPLSAFIFVVTSFSILLYAHIFDHFELMNVFLHSHSKKPLLYKIGGTWGSHEGSMMLWCVFLAFFNIILRTLTLPEHLKRLSMILSGVLGIQFLLFLLVASNPFTYLSGIPHEGQDLNPVLQDFSLTIHPPHLYLGTLGFALPFIISLTCMLSKKIDLQTVKQLKALTLFAQFFLTLGIILGAVWAYYELGWGGWWFFDPVENLALAPWLLGLVSMHRLMIAQRNPDYAQKVILPSAYPFLMCLGSLCLVRSGLLNSVHNFAADSKRSILLVSIFLVWIVITAFVYIRFKRNCAPTVPFYKERWDRNFYITLAMCGVRGLFIILIMGTLFPLISPFFSSSLTPMNLELGMGYFTHSFMIFTIPIALILIIAPHVTGNPSSELLQRIIFNNLAMALPLLIFFYVVFDKNILITLFSTLGILIIVSELSLILKRFSLRTLGQHISHSGFGIALVGIILSTLLSFEKNIALPLQKEEDMGPFSLRLENVEKIEGPNYHAERGIVTLTAQGKTYPLTPEERFYWTQDNRHMETSIVTQNYVHQVHLILGDRYKDKKTGTTYYGFKVIYKPYINVMWLGFILLITGIGISCAHEIRRRF